MFAWAKNSLEQDLNFSTLVDIQNVSRVLKLASTGPERAAPSQFCGSATFLGSVLWSPQLHSVTHPFIYGCDLGKLQSAVTL